MPNFQRRGPDSSHSENIFAIKFSCRVAGLKVHVCFSVYLVTVLIEDCVSDVVHWFACQGLGQDMTENYGGMKVLHCLNLYIWQDLRPWK